MGDVIRKTLLQEPNEWKADCFFVTRWLAVTYVPMSVNVYIKGSSSKPVVSNRSFQWSLFADAILKQQQLQRHLTQNKCCSLQVPFIEIQINSIQFFCIYNANLKWHWRQVASLFQTKVRPSCRPHSVYLVAKDVFVAEKSLVKQHIFLPHFPCSHSMTQTNGSCLRCDKPEAREAAVWYSGEAVTKYNTTTYQVVFVSWVESFVLSQILLSFAAPDHWAKVFFMASVMWFVALLEKSIEPFLNLAWVGWHVLCQMDCSPASPCAACTCCNVEISQVGSKEAFVGGRGSHTFGTCSPRYTPTLASFRDSKRWSVCVVVLSFTSLHHRGYWIYSLY